MLFAADPVSVSPAGLTQSIDPSHFLHTWAAVIILGIILLHHILHLIAVLFHWPPLLVKFFHRRLKEEVRAALDEMGFDDRWRERVNTATLEERLDGAGRYKDATARCMGLLKQHISTNPVEIGATVRMSSSYFIDLMSATVDPTVAKECATILASHLRNNEGRKWGFTTIVGLKQGSPLIAVMLAEILGLPVALYRGKEDYRHTTGSGVTDLLFDGVLEKGCRVLIVDDSTTGGRKVIDCATDLRKMGCDVEKCLVLFEPLGKGARTLLIQNGLELESVVKMDKAVQKKLGVPRPKDDGPEEPVEAPDTGD